MNKILFSLLLLTGFVAGCSTQDEPEPSKTASARQQNIERYLQKAKEYNQLRAQRQEPLPAVALLSPQQVKNLNPEELMASLPDELLQAKESLEKTVREQYGQSASQKAGALILSYHQQALQAVSGADSPKEMAQRLLALDKDYQQKLQAFVREEQSKTWLRPDDRQLQEAKEAMLSKNKTLLADVRQYYGEECAHHAEPVLTWTVDDYIAAMRQAKTPGELETRLAQVSAEGDRKLKEVVEKYGDPSGMTSDEDVATMRTAMLTQYEPLEQRIETLYGRTGALEARDLFEKLMTRATKIARTNMRVSQKRAEVARLNKQFLSDIAKLQAELNDRMVKRQERQTRKTEHVNAAAAH